MTFSDPSAHLHTEEAKLIDLATFSSLPLVCFEPHGLISGSWPLLCPAQAGTSSSLPPFPIDPLMSEMASSSPQVFTCTATQPILQAWEPSLIGQWPSAGLTYR